ncbi:MAG: Gfo/Idh/MocA family oxidoreductase [Rikenellaceae bacterium]|jgi:hypothetical protein|nr:Gfo/Idh/MocA family oxidoreductase [Rikenellaceae bacterium]
MKRIFLPFALAALLFAGGCAPKGDLLTFPVPERAPGQSDMLAFAAEPIPVVRVGFIGIGMRGIGAVDRFTHLEGVEIKAICDLEPYNMERAQAVLTAKGLPQAAPYTGDENAWKQLCERDDIDLVYISTDWLNHTPMAVYAMECGKHVAVEVPAALTVADCWRLVDTSECTRRHCMMLENCCYDFFELATLNMAQQGLFGEVMHAEGAYIHDLRWLNFGERLSEKGSFVPGSADEKRKLPGLAGYYDHWRLKYNQTHTGNPYPTHGLGPVCQALDIHRGDRMEYLVSVSTAQRGMSAYAGQKFGAGSPEARQEYKMGDMNTSIIRTAKGKTILVQHDVTSPRPYSRIHLVSGTKGFAQKYPLRQIALEPDAHNPLSNAQIDSLLAQYQFPFVQRIGEKARAVGGHGGMDFIMDYRLVYCLQRGLPLDQDVYDAAEWSCLVELTERSATSHGAPVAIPDFTRGAWDKIKGYRHAY